MEQIGLLCVAELSKIASGNTLRFFFFFFKETCEIMAFHLHLSTWDKNSSVSAIGFFFFSLRIEQNRPLLSLYMYNEIMANEITLIHQCL